MPLLDQLLRRPAHSLAASFTSHRIFLYVLFSTFAVAAAVTNALKNHSNFYSITIYLSKSSRSILVLANFALIVALVCGHITQRIFFGSLRPNEIERLYDRLWFFITESLLAFTIFRDEFDIPFALMFGFLLFVKSFHWLASDRIEWMDQRPYPGPPLLFHIRMTTLFSILWLTDFIMFLVAVENTLTHGVGGMVLFASEYGILMASVSNTIAKYLLSAYELRRAGQRGGENAPPWENKSMWVFYIELTTDFLKLTTYLAFFSVIITFYGLPLNIIRDVYITARSLYTRLHALHRYQIATRNMDQRYPNATEEELSTMSDHTCIICREEMVAPAPTGDGQTAPTPQSDGPNMTPKKLPCGHIFHFHCLRSWLERQQSCPTCRRTVLDNTNLPGQAPAGPGAPPPGAQQQQQQQQPNPFGGAGAQNPNAVPRNDVGLLGRLLGNQNQQPAAPRRAAGLPTQGNLGPPNVTSDATGRVVIQYNINYQVPIRQDRPNEEGQAPPQPHPELRPVPPFHGFEGPGNVWQPWPTNPDPNPAPDSQVPSATASRDPSSPDSQRSPDPQPSTSSPTGSSDSAPPAATTRNPREEAGLAALRRFNSPNAPDGTVTPAPTQGGSLAPTQTIPEPQRQPFDVPGLIPLYEFNLDTPAATFQPASLPSGSHNQAPIPNPSGNPSTSTFGSSGPLPPSLTDEQLAVLDKLTREAIDERLRVLERVSASVHNNMEDLLRMRSVLPTAPITNATGFNGNVGNGLTDPSSSSHDFSKARTPEPSGSGA